MVTHLSTVQAHGCLTLLIFPFILTAFTFALSWYCAKVSFQGFVSSEL